MRHGGIARARGRRSLPVVSATCDPVRMVAHAHAMPADRASHYTVACPQTTATARARASGPRGTVRRPDRSIAPESLLSLFLAALGRVVVTRHQ